MTQEDPNNIPETIIVKDKPKSKRQLSPEHLEMLARARTKALEVRRQNKELKEKKNLVEKEEKLKEVKQIEDKHEALCKKKEPTHQSPPVEILEQEDKKYEKKIKKQVLMTPPPSEDDEPEIIYKKKPKKKKKKQVIVYESSSSDEEQVIKIPKRKLIKYASKYQAHKNHNNYQLQHEASQQQQPQRPSYNPLTSFNRY